MTLRQIGAVVVCAFALMTTAAEAKHRHFQARPDSQVACLPFWDNSGHVTCAPRQEPVSGHARAARDANGNDARPRAWCGWWMRHHLGVADRAGNLARWWARYGSNAHGPGEGVIVVWSHHVGIITGKTASGWVIKSGNDGGAVRERERSLRGVIAFRRPNGMASR